jgi:ketosteroid isomerase-like protein
MEQADHALLEDNLAIARRFIDEILGAADPSTFDDLVADDIRVTTILKPTGVIEGKSEYLHVLGQTVSGQFANRELIAEDIAPLLDGRVLARVTAKFTHVGEVFGIPPTQQRITMRELLLMRFRDGKIIELVTGSLIPPEFEMLFAPAIRELVFGTWI